MNEIDLIREVEKRPILYDKNISGFNKTRLRDDAWKEVQEALNVSAEAECKKRWRSLRDSFIKLQRTHGGRTRWPYHQAMRFLLPHIDIKDGNQVTKRDTEDSDQDQDFRQNTSSTSYSEPSEPANDDDDDDDSSSSEPSSKKARTDSDDDCQTCNKRTDPDELFLLSCAPTLKRLNAKQNAGARLKIQQVLYEAEFGVQPQPQIELPYAMPVIDELSYE